MAIPAEPCGYGRAQQEVLRTAYVVITRAFTHCYWCVFWDEKVPALEKASRYISVDQAYSNIVTPRLAPPSDGMTTAPTNSTRTMTRTGNHVFKTSA